MAIREDTDAQEAWPLELEQRMDEALTAAAKLEDWATVRRRIEAHLRLANRD